MIDKETYIAWLEEKTKAIDNLQIPALEARVIELIEYEFMAKEELRLIKERIAYLVQTKH